MFFNLLLLWKNVFKITEEIFLFVSKQRQLEILRFEKCAWVYCQAFLDYLEIETLKDDKTQASRKQLKIQQRTQSFGKIPNKKHIWFLIPWPIWNYRGDIVKRSKISHLNFSLDSLGGALGLSPWETPTSAKPETDFGAYFMKEILL